MSCFVLGHNLNEVCMRVGVFVGVEAIEVLAWGAGAPYTSSLRCGGAAHLGELGATPRAGSTGSCQK
jgi:hypothetical protein